MSVVAEFAKFRMLRDAPVPEVPPPLEFDEEDLLKKIMESYAFKEAISRSMMPYIHGAGVAPSRVQFLERRIVNLEAATPVAGATVNYIEVVDAGTTTLAASDLPLGINIIGVDAAGPVTLRLPQTLDQGTIVKIKDESLNASVNNITIETYLEI